MSTRLVAVEPRWRERSTLRRAVVPVVGGIGFFALLGLTTWGIAAFMSRNPERVEERLAATTFEVGGIEFVADQIDQGGPILFQGLVGDDAERSVVLNHTGDDPERGWSVRYAFPADRDDSCPVRQVEGTASFTDCAGRTLGYDDLARPERVRPLISDVVVLDLRGAADDLTDQVGTTSPPATSESP
ncbi:MAG: hypothetical protein KDB40_15965 [Acidimicrobiales bacterium]|nr:hypothetical protein [Acidimicrobiales bacterium]MCB9393516.1 hypothetical protein [Acidimicrobiaceae bacterium]